MDTGMTVAEMDELPSSDRVFVVYTRVDAYQMRMRVFTDRDKARAFLRDEREYHAKVTAVIYDRHDDLTIW